LSLGLLTHVMKLPLMPFACCATTLPNNSVLPAKIRTYRVTYYPKYKGKVTSFSRVSLRY